MTAAATRLEVHRSISAIAAEWDALADASDAPPHARPGWYAAWLAAFASGAEPTVLGLRRGGDLVAVLPLLARYGRLRSPTNWHTPAYALLAADDAAADELLARLFRMRSWNVTLGFLDPPTAQLARAVAQRCGRVVTERTLLQTPYVELGTGPVLERLDAKSRRVLARRRRRLEERGAVTLQLHRGAEQLDERMQLWFSLEASSWKGRQGDDVLARPETTRFYVDVARWAASQGSLLLAFLCLDERPIAFQLAFVGRTRWHFLRTGYDEELKAFGPGKLLMAELFDRATASGVDQVALGGADDAYKMEWTERVQPYVELQAFARSPIGAAAHLVQLRLAPIARNVLHRVRSLKPSTANASASTPPPT